MSIKLNIVDNQVTLKVDDLTELMKMYMPYIEDGAIFISTNNEYKLGSQINLTLETMNQKFEIVGTVIWYSPPNTQVGNTSGIGIKFPENSSEIKTYFDNLLANSSGNLITNPI